MCCSSTDDRSSVGVEGRTLALDSLTAETSPISLTPCPAAPACPASASSACTGALDHRRDRRHNFRTGCALSEPEETLSRREPEDCECGRSPRTLRRIVLRRERLLAAEMVP